MTQLHLEQLTLDEWDDVLPASGVEVFHSAAVLGAIDQQFDGEMRLLGAYKGEQPVALLPTFERKNALGRVIVSPPPSMGIPYIGPVMMPNSPKQSTYEMVNKDFSSLVMDELGVRSNRAFVRIICSPSYVDPRPFDWAGFAVSPSFTYRIDVATQSLDDVQAQFSSSLRKEIRKARGFDDIVVRDEGLEGARLVYDDVISRYNEQDEAFGMPWEFLESVVRDLGDNCRVYVARDPDGEYLSGMVVPFTDDVAYYWLGGARASYGGVSINNLIHWTVLEDITHDDSLASIKSYDLVGANNERLCDYKSKFGGELVPYYTVESAGVGMNIAKRTYQLLNRNGEKVPTK
ncbi:MULTISPECIES: GNAT family N-acetyltransferase [Haloferax]|uniref:GNAT family N-acetyltransferase n=1 Tax=Haloferax marinum TaxID=2666143 RepID=A0A6A8GD64_9EURY|nr:MULTISPECIES: GNAT family N-acetyltransferase [Haloferax]KAB1191222.1 GNAT family N-acetyltransferase [Haloferax sp. CBA1150]MRW98113.1 GNAT family N-acetyltransferase [Haloferax marinum]